MILHATRHINNVGKSLFRKVISLLSIGVMASLGAGYCMSAGLGDIQIQSRVGQPLLATIETTLESSLPGDQIVARIASAETHREFNVPFDPYLDGVRITQLQTEQGMLFVLRAERSLEQFHLELVVELVVELELASAASSYRAYTLLPLFDLRKPNSNPEPAKKTAARPPKKPPETGRPRASPRAIRTPVKAGPYIVAPLDSIWWIASRMDAILGSVNQRIDLLRFYNPQLSRNNHTMHPGDLLTIPEDALEAAIVMADPQPQGTEPESAQPEDPTQLVISRETDEDKLSYERRSDKVDQVISLDEVPTYQQQTRQYQSDIIHLEKSNEQREQRLQQLRNRVHLLAARIEAMSSPIQDLGQQLTDQAASPQSPESGTQRLFGIDTFLLLLAVLPIWYWFRRWKPTNAYRDTATPAPASEQLLVISKTDVGDAAHRSLLEQQATPAGIDSLASAQYSAEPAALSDPPNKLDGQTELKPERFEPDIHPDDEAEWAISLDDGFDSDEDELVELHHPDADDCSEAPVDGTLKVNGEDNRQRVADSTEKQVETEMLSPDETEQESSKNGESLWRVIRENPSSTEPDNLSQSPNHSNHDSGHDDAESQLVAKVRIMLHERKFEVHYQTLIDLVDSSAGLLMCKTDLADDIDRGPLPEDFLEKCFACAAGPDIERFSITTALQKLLTLDSQAGMMFRVNIRSAIDPQFENWLFELVTCLKVDHRRIVLLLYAADVMRHRAQVARLSATLKRGGIRLGMLNVDYDSNHLEAAIDVGAAIVRVAPEIVDEVVESKTKFDSRPIGSATRESAKLREFLEGFHERSIETVVFSPYRDSIPELVVLNATQLRATYIQTPTGMIESSAVD